VRSSQGVRKINKKEAHLCRIFDLGDMQNWNTSNLGVCRGLQFWFRGTQVPKGWEPLSPKISICSRYSIMCFSILIWSYYSKLTKYFTFTFFFHAFFLNCKV
jgi:hypothetical protein